MIIVTGGAGFIGNNIVRQLNKLGHEDILVVDNLTNGLKVKNLADCKIADYIDKEDFINKIKNSFNQDFSNIEIIFHQGACSSTTEWNGAYVMRNNYEYSKVLLHHCHAYNIPFVYASSASVYGASKNFQEKSENEKPLNIYGYSKLLFDQYVRRFIATNKTTKQIIGLRYFNVYGPHEQHKNSQASVAFHANNQIIQENKIKLFSGSDGYSDGEQVRDFVYVEDIVNLNIWFWQNQNSNQSGVYNAGTGKAESFNSMAQAVINWHKRGKIEYIPFPEHLKSHYQSFTQADLTQLRSAGCDIAFRDVASGVRDYLNATK